MLTRWFNLLLGALSGAKVAEVLRAQVGLLTSERDAALRKMADAKAEKEEAELRALRASVDEQEARLRANQAEARVKTLQADNLQLRFEKEELRKKLAELSKGFDAPGQQVSSGGKFALTRTPPDALPLS